MITKDVEKVMKKLIVQLLEFPDSKVCKHWAACNILSEMEQMGSEVVTNELAGAVIEARDEDAVAILNESDNEKD